MATAKRRPLVAGNWKMHGTRASLREVTALKAALSQAARRPRCGILICPPATLVRAMRDAAKGAPPIAIGAQDCHWAETGAHTGDISAIMLKDAGATSVIVGHSERRADHGETDKQVAAKAKAAHDAGLTAIICIGETDAERNAGAALRVVGGQLKGSLPKSADARNTVIAYEPVWAIGTGKTPTADDVAKVHAHIRKRLHALVGDEEGRKIRILYGGSVKPANATELMAVANVDGALVGGASLKAKDFFGIIQAYL